MHTKNLFSKDFTLVLIGQIISLFGNQILRYALPLYLLTQTGSSALFGTVSAFSFIPMLLLFPIGGIIADRVNKRNIMVTLDFSTTILIFLFSLLIGKINLVLLMSLTMIILYGIQGIYQPTVKASIPVLVNEANMMKGNSIVDLVNSLASMIGPIIGGILFSIIGLTPILYISTACFFISAVMELFITIPFEKDNLTQNIFATAFLDLKESFQFMFRERPTLWKMSLVYASVNLLLTSLILIAMPVIITQHLDFTPNTANRLYGYAQGVLAAGSILGGLLTGILSKKLTLKMSPFLLIGCSLTILLGGIALQIPINNMETYLLLIISCSALLLLTTLFQIQVMTYIQILTPNRMIGKIISCVMCICMCTNPLGQFVYGLVFEHIGTATYLPFYCAALLMFLVTIATRKIFYQTDQLLEQQK